MEQIAVFVPVQRVGDPLVVYSTAIGKQAKAEGDSLGSSHDRLPRLTAHGSQVVAVGVAFEAAGRLGGQSQRDGRVVGLLDVGGPERSAVFGLVRRLPRDGPLLAAGAGAPAVPYMPPIRSPPISVTRLRLFAAAPKTKWL